MKLIALCFFLTACSVMTGYAGTAKPIDKAPANPLKPMKVYVFAGQSNMTGMARAIPNS
jgi:hypothetical protein